MSACGEDKESPADLGVVLVTEGVSTPTTWVNTNVYVVVSSISVTAALTIEPGTVVKLEAGRSISVDVGGSIVADATSTSPCVFTSMKDDAHGGDTNEDGSATTPAPGDWAYVAVRTDGSVFDRCEFYYGGGNMPYNGTLVVDDCSVTVTNSTFAHNQGGTPADTRAATLNAAAGGASTVLTGNTFYDNDLPLLIGGAFGVDDSNVFHQPGAVPAVTNTYNGVFWGGSYALAGDIVWSETEVPYAVVGNPVSVAVGASLTLADGVVVKLDMGKRIDVAGTLTASGTTGVVFTSLRDDSLLGDTNGDGTATSAAPGDWGYVGVAASGSTFNHATFSYGGSGKPYHGTLEVSNDAVVTVTGCTFSHNAGGTPNDTRAAALNLSAAGAGATVTGNVFFANDMPLVVSAVVSVDDTNVFHDPAVATNPPTNLYNGIFVTGPVDGATIWSNTEVAYAIYGGVLTIEATGALTLANDVVVKLENGRIDLMGTLAQGTGDTFSSLRDDTLLGDTNGDADATIPVKGDWAGVNVCQGGPCSYAAWSNILYATNP